MSVHSTPRYRIGIFRSRRPLSLFLLLPLPLLLLLLLLLLLPPPLLPPPPLLRVAAMPAGRQAGLRVRLLVFAYQMGSSLSPRLP